MGNVSSPPARDTTNTRVRRASRASAMAQHAKRSASSSLPNVTPMIDVMMCLIIFFLLVGRLVAEQRAEMVLPPAHSGTDEKIPDNLFVNITPARNLRTGERTQRVDIVVENQTVDTDRLAQILRDRLSAQSETVIHVRADKSLPFSAIVPVINTCRDVGIGSIRLAAEHIQ